MQVKQTFFLTCFNQHHMFCPNGCIATTLPPLKKAEVQKINAFQPICIEFWKHVLMPSPNCVPGTIDLRQVDVHCRNITGLRLDRLF